MNERGGLLKHEYPRFLNFLNKNLALLIRLLIMGNYLSNPKMVPMPLAMH